MLVIPYTRAGWPWLLVLLLGGGHRAASQSIQPATTGAQSCFVGPTDSKLVYNYLPGNTELKVLRWQALGELQLTGQNNASAEAASTGPGPGRIQATLSDCQVVFYDVLKKFSASGPITGPTCVVMDGSLVAYTVEPVVNSARVLADGLPPDLYDWKVSPVGAASIVWLSGDGSAVTLKPSSSEPFTLSVGIGRCAGQGASLRVNLQPLRPAFQAPLPDCQPTTDNSAFTLTLDPATVSAGATYTWQAPPAWLLGVDATGTSATITPDAQPGTVTMTVAYPTGGCATQTISFTLLRGLAEPRNAISGGSTTACYTPGATYRFTVPQPPATSGFAWVLPANWTLLSGQGTPSITARPDDAAASQSGFVRVSLTDCPAREVSRQVLVSGPQAGCTYTVIRMTGLCNAYGAKIAAGSNCTYIRNMYTFYLCDASNAVLEQYGPSTTPSHNFVSRNYTNCTVRIRITNGTAGICSAADATPLTGVDWVNCRRSATEARRSERQPSTRRLSPDSKTVVVLPTQNSSRKAR